MQRQICNRHVPLRASNLSARLKSPGVISRRLSVSSPLHRRPSPSEALPRSPLSLTLPVQVFQRSSGAECNGDQQDNKRGAGGGGRIGEVKKQRAEVQV